MRMPGAAEQPVWRPGISRRNVVWLTGLPGKGGRNILCRRGAGVPGAPESGKRLAGKGFLFSCAPLLRDAFRECSGMRGVGQKGQAVRMP